MGFLRRPKVPSWASGMSTEEYDEFWLIVKHILGMRLLSREPDTDGVVEIDPRPNKPEPLAKVSLVNLAALCAQVDRDDWKIVIPDFLAWLFDPDVNPTTIEEAGPLLRVRLLAEDFQFSGGQIVNRAVTDGLISVVVVDQPNGMSFVTHQQANDWGIEHGRLFAMSEQNTRNEPRTIRVVQGEAPLRFLTSEHWYASSHLLWLDEVLDQPAPFGAIASIPTRDFLTFQPVRDASIAASIDGSIAWTARVFADGPWSLSPNLLWWRASSISVLTSFDGVTVRFTPPPEFVEILERLPSVHSGAGT